MYLFLQIHSKCERHAGYSLLHFSSFCRVRVCVLNDHIFDHFQTNSLTHSTTKISMEPIYLFNYDESKKKGEWRNGNQKKKRKNLSTIHTQCNPLITFFSLIFFLFFACLQYWVWIWTISFFFALCCVCFGLLYQTYAQYSVECSLMAIFAPIRQKFIFIQFINWIRW